jgi:type III pantothenate kinase
VTFDALDAGGQHLGGLILAGPRLAAAALAQATHDIGATPLAGRPPPGIELLGKSTAEAVGNGAMLAVAAALDRACRTVAVMLGAPPRVLLAGGDAPALAPWLETEAELRADLVLEGLALIMAATAGAQ